VVVVCVCARALKLRGSTSPPKPGSFSGSSSIPPSLPSLTSYLQERASAVYLRRNRKRSTPDLQLYLVQYIYCKLTITLHILNPKTLMLSRAGQCGIETAKTSLAEVHAVATMDRPQKYAHLGISEATLSCASTLHLHGLSFDYDALRDVDPPPPTHTPCAILP